MKHKITTALLAVICIGWFSGCGVEVTTKTEPPTPTLTSQMDALEAQMRELEKANARNHDTLLFAAGIMYSKGMITLEQVQQTFGILGTNNPCH